MAPKRSRRVVLWWSLVLLLAGGIPVPHSGFDQGAATAWHTLFPLAQAEAADDYLVQIESAMSQIERHMHRLSQTTEADQLARCSFQVERRKYYAVRDALRREIQRARLDPPSSAQTRRGIETRFSELQSTYSRAISCYQ